MRFHFMLATVLASLTWSISAQAQHAGDFLVDYQNNKVLQVAGPGGYLEGEFNPPSIFLGELLPFTDDPGFDTYGESTGIYGLIPGDILGYNVLGPLVYHDGMNFAPASVNLTITK